MKSQIFKEIGKQLQLLPGNEVSFIPMPLAKFFSDDFGNLDEAAKISELGVHQIPSQDNYFAVQDYDFTQIYESFLDTGFEIVGMTQEQVNQYYKDRKEQEDKIPKEQRELLDEFEELQDQLFSLDDNSKVGAQNITRKLKRIRSQLIKDQVDTSLINSGVKNLDLERIRKAKIKFEKYTKNYEIATGANEERTFDQDTYLKCNFAPQNYASLLKVDSNGKNKSLQYEKFTRTLEQLKASAKQEGDSWNAELDVSYEMMQLGGGVSGQKSQSFSNEQLKNLKVSMSLTTIYVERPWFDSELFKSDKIASKGEKRGSWSQHKCPYMIYAVVVAKDLVISGIDMSQQQKDDSKKLGANAKISVMGFGKGSGGYASNSSVNSQSFDYDSGVYSCTAPHIIGYLCKKFPEFPRVDSQQQTQATIKEKKNNVFGAIHPEVFHIDQKSTNYCVRAAIATAVTSQVLERTQNNVLIDQKALYQGLIQTGYVTACDDNQNLTQRLSAAEDAIEPKVLNQTYVVVLDNYMNPYRLKLLIRDLQSNEVPLDDMIGHYYLLGYDIYTQKRQKSPDSKPKLHCVAVDQIENGVVTGFNSWGSSQPKPQMSIFDPYVQLWQILVQEVLEVDVLVAPDDRADLATPVDKKLVDLFDSSHETQIWYGANMDVSWAYRHKTNLGTKAWDWTETSHAQKHFENGNQGDFLPVAGKIKQAIKISTNSHWICEGRQNGSSQVFVNVSLENFGIDDQLAKLQDHYPTGGNWIGFIYKADETVEIKHLGGFSEVTTGINQDKVAYWDGTKYENKSINDLEKSRFASAEPATQSGFGGGEPAKQIKLDVEEPSKMEESKEQSKPLQNVVNLRKLIEVDKSKILTQFTIVDQKGRKFQFGCEEETSLEVLRHNIENSIKNDFMFLNEDNQEIRKRTEKKFEVGDIMVQQNTIRIRVIFPPKTPKEGSIFVEKTKDGMEIYQYQHKLTIEEQNTAKVIVVMGGTGTGKTTFLNAYVNYLLGIQKTDCFRYRLIDESKLKKKKVEGQSITDDVITYHIEACGQNPSLIVIDTPGFGDTRGPTQDLVISQQIQNLFETKLQTVTAVCLVVQSSTTRMTPTERFIIANITKIFGKDIGSNFCIMATFCDGSTPNVIATLQNSDEFKAILSEAKNPFFRFQNGVIYESHLQNDSMQQTFWDLCMKGYATFTQDKLLKLKDCSLQITKETLKQRQNINDRVVELKATLMDLTYQTVELVRYRNFLQDCQEAIEDNRNFTYTRKQVKFDEIKVEDGYFSTVCTQCPNQSCHDRCRFPDPEKEKCIVMEDGVCTKCTHDWHVHANTGFFYKKYVVEEECEFDNIKKKFEEENQKQASFENMIQNIEDEIRDKRSQEFHLSQKIRNSITKLREIALVQNPYVSMNDYLKTLLKAIEDNKEKDWELQRDEIKQILAINEEVMKQIEEDEKSNPPQRSIGKKSVNQTIRAEEQKILQAYKKVEEKNSSKSNCILF